MPTPAKTSRLKLVAIARAIVETDGAAGLTMAAVAEAAGIKGPSLYKHFADRAALLKEVELDVLAELEATLRLAMKGHSPAIRIANMAHAYRAFALRHPHLYSLNYSGNAGDDAEVAAALRASATPLFEQLQEAGITSERILPLSRALTAFLHGFATMQIANAFRLGGDVEVGFAAALAILLSELRTESSNRHGNHPLDV